MVQETKPERGLGMMLAMKTISGKEALGAFLVWVVATLTFTLVAGLAWQSVLVGLSAIVFARYPDADILFYLLRRALVRQSLYAKRIPAWWAKSIVTAMFVLTSLTTLTLVPMGLLAYFGAPAPLGVVALLSLGIVYASIRAKKLHQTRIGSHWLFGHYPLLLVPAASVIGFQLGALMGSGGWYLATLFALATLWHFFQDASQEQLGIPLFAPLSMRVHVTARGHLVDADMFFRQESEAFYQRLPDSWRAELKEMALQEDGGH